MFRRDSIATGFSWTAGAALAALLLFLLGRLLGAVAGMIAPFVIAFVLTLLLDPVADRIQERYTKKRFPAVLIVFVGLLLLLAGLMAFLVPNLVSQTSRLILFFAPLSYRIEAARPGERFRILERNITGASYTVNRLENGQAYVFRVFAKDADGKVYKLTPVQARPQSRNQANKDDFPASTTTRSTPDSTSRPATPAPEPQPAETPEVEPAPVETPERATIARPTVTPSPAGNRQAPFLFPDLPRSASPAPQTTPSPGSQDEEQSGNFDETQVDPGENDVAAGDAPTTEDNAEPFSSKPLFPPLWGGATASPAASLSPSPTPTESVRSDTPALPAVITPASSATPDLLPTPSPSVSPVPLRTPTAPEPRPVPTSAPTADATPEPTQGQKPTDRARTEAIRTANQLPRAEPITPRAGTVVAVSGDRQVRLLWKPPADAESGFDRLRAQTDIWLTEHRNIGPIKLPPNLAAIQAQYSDQVADLVQTVSRRAADVIVGSISTAMTVVLSLIITFYMLMDFDRLRMRLLSFLPTRFRADTVSMLTDVGSVFGNYVRGMSLVATAYGIVAFILFLLLGMVFNIGLKGYALLLGVLAGVLYPVPFLGPIITSLLAAAVALATGGNIWQTLAVLGVVQVTNFIFDNVVVPKVVGGTVGLHPLTTIFALLLGGQVFGLPGMLLAVPTAASIQKLLIRVYPALGQKTPMGVQNATWKTKRESERTEGNGAGHGAPVLEPPVPPSPAPREASVTAPLSPQSSVPAPPDGPEPSSPVSPEAPRSAPVETPSSKPAPPSDTPVSG